MQEELARWLTYLFAPLFSKWISRHLPPALQREIWSYIWPILLFAGIVWLLQAVVRELFVWGNRQSTRGLLKARVARVREAVGPLQIESTRGYRWPVLAAMAGLFCAAIGTWPYDFYTLLRFAILATCLALVFGAGLATQHRFWACTLAGIGLLYNPFLPAHLHRETWAAINWATLAFFGFLLVLMKPRGTNTVTSQSTTVATRSSLARGSDGRFLPKLPKNGTKDG